MAKRLEIKQGDRYGRLTIEKEIEPIDKRRMFVCKCDCGNKTTVSRNNLRSGHTTSCGCYKKERMVEGNIKHGDFGTRLYGIWNGTRNRCNNKKVRAYKNYGGRGIKVCKEWENSYISFKKWALENGYTENLTIERKNVNGNYEPSNCKWATVKEQGNNKTSNRNITYKGVTKTLQQWSDKFGFEKGTLRTRLENHSIEESLETPVGAMKRKVVNK